MKVFQNICACLRKKKREEIEKGLKGMSLWNTGIPGTAKLMNQNFAKIIIIFKFRERMPYMQNF